MSHTVHIEKIMADEAMRRGAVILQFEEDGEATGSMTLPFLHHNHSPERVHFSAHGELRAPTFTCGLRFVFMGRLLHLAVKKGKLEAYGDTEWLVAATPTAPESDAEPEGDTLVDGSPDTPEGREDLREAAESGGVDQLDVLDDGSDNPDVFDERD